MAGGKLISTGVEFPDATTQTTSGLPLTGGTMTGTIAGFTSTGIDDNATSTAITIDSSEKVNFQGLQINFAGASGASKGITTSEGVAGTGNMYIQAGVGSAAAGGGIRLYAHAHATKPGDVAVGISQGSGGSFRVNTTGTDGGTNLIQVDTDGLKFNGDTAAANALDDYEEGNHPTAFTAATSGTITVGRNDLHYTKIGNVVHCTGEIVISSVSSPAGHTRMTLPFVVASHTVDRNMNSGAHINTYSVAWSEGNPPVLNFATGDSFVTILYLSDNAAFVPYNAAAGDTYFMSFSYKTN